MLFYFAFNLAFLGFLTKPALDFQMNLNGGENQFEPEDISLPYMVFFFDILYFILRSWIIYVPNITL